MYFDLPTVQDAQSDMKALVIPPDKKKKVSSPKAPQKPRSGRKSRRRARKQRLPDGEGSQSPLKPRKLFEEGSEEEPDPSPDTGTTLRGKQEPLEDDDEDAGTDCEDDDVLGGRFAVAQKKKQGGLGCFRAFGF